MNRSSGLSGAVELFLGDHLPQNPGAGGMIDTLSANVSADYDAIVRRSAAGVASCKEVLALMRARQATEEAYGNALLKQGRSAAGLMGAPGH